MSQFWRDVLFDHMRWHIERGVDFDEAFILGIKEINRQLRGSNPKIAAKLIEEAKRYIHYECEYGKLH